MAMGQGERVVRSLDDATVERWDRFVDQCSEATFFHRAGWKRIVEAAFGHRCHYLYAECDGVIEGVLPLVHIRSRLFHDALISNAYCVYGGPAAVNSVAREALDGRAAELADQLNVDYIEYRSRHRDHPEWASNSSLYATFRKQIWPEPERNLLAIPRKQRAMVRKGIKLGLRSEIDSGIERFFRAYATSVRNLGTPVFPRRYFQNLKDVFGEDCCILTVVQGGVSVASVLSFYFRDEVLPYYGGGTPAAREVAGNDFMYWEVMRRACVRNCNVFDFGRSKRGTGSFAFKQHWGFEATPLHYEYKLGRTKVIPEINPMNPRYQLFVRAWRWLPLPVANWVGPFVARGLG